MPELPPVHACECAVCQAGTDPATAHQHAQINLFLSRLTEPQRRWYAGVLSQTSAALSDRQLALITGLDPKTIARGRAELAAGLPVVVPPRQRHPGGGRHYAPQQLPPDQQERVQADEGATGVSPDDTPAAGPANTSDNLLLDLTTEADVEEDADQEGSNKPRVLPPLPIRSGLGLGQIG